jgi:hypothetical protein
MISAFSLAVLLLAFPCVGSGVDWAGVATYPELSANITDAGDPSMNGTTEDQSFNVLTKDGFEATDS